MLYVAYGSNMNRRQMARRCPKARPLSGIWLEGWRLVMKRVADIEPDPHALTPAALWEITRSCERALDACAYCLRLAYPTYSPEHAHFQASSSSDFLNVLSSVRLVK